MQFTELADFKILKQLKKPILAIDLGKKRIGVAISDENWIISSPLKLLENKNFTWVASEIFNLFDERQCCGILLGLPLSMNGEENKSCQSIRQFGRNLLKQRSDLKISFIDERFSSIAMENSLRKTDISRNRKNDLIDKMSASYFLQTFLDSI